MSATLEDIVRAAIDRNFPSATGISMLESAGGARRDSLFDQVVRVRFSTGDLTRIEQFVVTTVPADLGARVEALGIALAGQSLPVPRILFSQPDDVGMHVVREFAPGSSLIHLLAGAPMRWELSTHGFTFARLLARIHNLDWRTLAPWLEDPGSPPEDLIAAQLDSWFEEWQAQVTRCPSDYQGDFQSALDWIDVNRPVEVSVCLCHGDYRPANVIMERDEVAAVVGWEHALVTDAAFDLCLLPFEMHQMGLPEHDADLLTQAIFGSYLQSSVRSLGNMQFFAVARLLDAALMALEPTGRSLNRIAAFSADSGTLVAAMRRAMSTDKRGLWKL